MTKLNKFIAACAAVVLAGCSAPTEDPEPAPEETSETVPPAEAEPSEEPAEVELESRTVSVDGGEAELTVGPLAVDDDVAILKLELTAKDDGVNESFSNPYLQPYYSPTGVQLLDAESGFVYHHGWSDSGAALTQGRGPLDAGESKELFIAFNTPDTDTPVAVIPHAGFFLPRVVDFADASGFPTAQELAETPESDLQFPVSQLETYSEELGGVLSTREGEDKTLLTISADVLFDKDSAELSSAADEALERAAERITGEGELTIVGHTDDVGTREHNQKLSEDRAESVADALGELVDLSGFDVVIEGRAFDEPAVDEKTEEARAENRRVEVSFEAAAKDSEKASGQELPEAAGPVGVGPEGIELEQKQPFSDEVAGTYEVKLERVQQVGKYLTGEIELTNLSDEEQHLIGVFSAGHTDSRGDLSFTDQNGANRLTLADGDAMYYPLDYATPERDYVMTGGERKSMGQPVRDLQPGESTIVTVVWPAVPGAEVTLESPWIPVFKDRPEVENRGGPPFRLTNIPVEDLQADSGADS